MSASEFRKKFENTVLALLIAGNAYFIKRLVDEIDNTKQIALETRQDVAVIKDKLTRVRMREASCDARGKRFSLGVVQLDFGGPNGIEAFLPIENVLDQRVGVGGDCCPGIIGLYPGQFHRSGRCLGGDQLGAAGGFQRQIGYQLNDDPGAY